MSIIEDALTKRDKSEKLPDEEIDFLTQPKPQRNKMVIILIVFLIFIIAGFIFLFYFKFTINKNYKIKKVNKKKSDNISLVKQFPKQSAKPNKISIATKKQEANKIKQKYAKTNKIAKIKKQKHVLKKTSVKTHIKTKKNKKSKKKIIENLLIDAYKKLQQGEFNEAIIVYNKILKYDNKTVEALINRAIAYQKLKKYSKAIKDLKIALSLTDKASYIYNILGVIYLEQNLPQKAMQSFLKSGTSEAYLNIAIMKWKQNDLNEVYKYLIKSLMLDPSNPYTHYYLGLYFKVKGDNEKASIEFEKALSYAKEKGEINLIKILSHMK